MAAPTTGPGEINAGSVYTLAEVNHRTGLGISALRTARRRGLKVKRIGRRGYILGSDLIAYIEREGK